MLPVRSSDLVQTVGVMLSLETSLSTVSEGTSTVTVTGVVEAVDDVPQCAVAVLVIIYGPPPAAELSTAEHRNVLV